MDLRGAQVQFTRGFTFATAAQQAAASEDSGENVAKVTPNTVQKHRGAAKAWVTFTDGNPPDIPTLGSFNIASVTHHVTLEGQYTITFDVDFVDEDYVVVGGLDNWDVSSEGSGAGCTSHAYDKLAGTVEVRLDYWLAGGGVQGIEDPASFVMFGSQ